MGYKISEKKELFYIDEEQEQLLLEQHNEKIETNEVLEW